MRLRPSLAIAMLVAALLVGCTNKYKPMVAEKDAEIARLQGQLDEAQGKLTAEENRTAQMNAELSKALDEYKKKEQVWIEQKNAQSLITIPDAVVFPSGSADIGPGGKDIMDKIAGVLVNYPDRAILVEGHTDNVPIGPELKQQFPSNWELSAARACTVLRYFYWQHKIDPARLAAIGYGEYRPVADNSTPEGRSKNRRVVIKVGPMSSQM
jgi:chemotaxis protein MotB